MAILFTIFLIADLILISGVVASILFPKHRIWPPSEKFSWQFWISWTFATIAMIGPPILGLLDFNSLNGWNWTYLLVGGALTVTGIIISLWGITTLSEHQSLGLKGKIITDGPYRYTRNPQYLAFIISYAGLILMTFSFTALVTTTILIATFLILPFSEEPWLLQQYGKAYKEYTMEVPRFISVKSLKRKNNKKEESKR